MEDYSDVTKYEIELKYKQISQRIRHIRLIKHFTQEQIALSMGFTSATFYTNAENFKSGKHFNLEHIIKISVILDVPIAEFFQDKENQLMTDIIPL